MATQKSAGVRKKRVPAALKEYRAKRNFAKSPEPTGAPSSSATKKPGREPFFCVQKHWASHLHYDFRLEFNGVLLSWAVPKGPSLNPKEKRLAMKVEDHPMDYGDFEGVIPEGYGAGVVMLWDTGTWQTETENIAAGLAKGELKFKLNGVKLKGSWVLIRTGGNDSRTWLLIKHRDEWAGDVDIAGLAPKSVKSQGSFKDILTRGAPEFWDSHRKNEAFVGDQLLKVIGKILAEEPAVGTATSPRRSRTDRSTAGKNTHVLRSR